MIKTSSLDLHQNENFEDFSINAFCSKVVVDPNPLSVNGDDSNSKIRIPLTSLNLNSNFSNEFAPTLEEVPEVSIEQ